MDPSVCFEFLLGAVSVTELIQDPALRRRDAEENRVRIIAAAREVFMLEGFEAPLETIARRAGVGRATVYRNFPDRYALGAAIIEHGLGTLEALARDRGDQQDALLVLLSAIVDDHGETYALVPPLLRGPNSSNLHVLVPRVMQLFALPLEQARAAGLVRNDLTLVDVIDMLAMISAIVPGETSAPMRRQRAARALDLLLQGIVARNA